MSQPLAPASGRIAELDGLRAFAVICVVLYHMSAFSGALPSGPAWSASLIGVLGQTGVHVFFIISGFIITTLLRREAAAKGRVSLTSFYLRRFCRIVPPFAAYLAALLVVGSLGAISVSTSDLLWSALFLGNTNLVQPEGWFAAHTWSLSVEEQFYLIFPPLFCLGLRFCASRTLYVLGPLYGLCLVSLKLGYELSIHVAPGWINLAGLHHFRYIIIGVLLATHGSSVMRFLTHRSRAWPFVFAVTIVLLQWVSARSFVAIAFAAIEPFFCGAFVIWFIQNPTRCSVLRWPAVQWIGACSYSIYLWQQLFTGPAPLYHGWTFTQSPWAIVPLTACAAASYYLVERPSIRLGRLLSGRRSIERDPDLKTAQDSSY